MVYKGFDCGNPTDNLTILNLRYFSGTAPQSTYPSTSTIVCRPGYVFSDASGSKVMNCDANGKWIIPGSCECMNFLDIRSSVSRFFPVVRIDPINCTN